MTRYERKWKCAVCDDLLIYDSEKCTLSCRCKTIEDYTIPQVWLNQNFRKAIDTETE